MHGLVEINLDYKFRDWVFKSTLQVQNKNWSGELGLGLGGLIWDPGRVG